MFGLLGERDRRFLSSDANLQSRPARVDAQVLVAQPAHQVEGLARRLLARESERVRGHRRLDRGSHLRRRAEEAIGGRHALEPLVRTLEVVVLHEERRAPLAIVEVGEYRARQELLPHRLPEALDLAAGLRVVRSALHVRDAVALELLLEGGGTPPGRVLPPLVGQDLARGSEVCDAARERLHHERALLVMRHHQAHQVARVIVHEGRHVDALVAAQQEREEIRLPQLVGLGALEALLLGPGLGLRRFAPRPQPLVFQHPTHRGLGSADTEEALHHVADAPAARLRLRALDCDDRLAAGVGLCGAGSTLAPSPRPRFKRGRSSQPIFARPIAHRGVGNLQLARHLLRREPLLHHHRRGRHHHVGRPARARLSACNVLVILRPSIRFRLHSVRSFRAARSAQSEVEC